MRLSVSVLAILIVVRFARADDSGQSWQIHGQVVDEQGAAVEDFEAATFWLSNGNWWNDAGELFKEAKEGNPADPTGKAAWRPPSLIAIPAVRSK
jgi:hypothetical protein